MPDAIAARTFKLWDRQYRTGETIDPMEWDRLSADKRRILISQNYIDTTGKVRRVRGRPKGAKDKKPRQRRKV